MAEFKGFEIQFSAEDEMKRIFRRMSE